MNLCFFFSYILLTLFGIKVQQPNKMGYIAFVLFLFPGTIYIIQEIKCSMSIR